ncbi:MULTISPECIES: capsid cement protein [Rhodococcus]|uniref:capsid cement protein n=1 Tax=Rhodococcus TaxID=1827 RepID=UPI0021C44924|nr:MULTISPECIES: capsid cement protein [Rhodococcus]MEA1796673.1 capsid cement protein [Rhodococcus qingshengii]
MANECAPLFRPGRDITGLTTAAVTGKTFVDVSATRDASGLIKVAPAAAGAKALGVAAFDAPSGGLLGILRGGILPVAAGGTIAFGAEVEVGASGKAITLATGKAVGKAVEAGTDGADVLIAFYE